jgi:hypothetical protein
MEKLFKENSPESLLNWVSKLGYDKNILKNVNDIYNGSLINISKSKELFSQAQKCIDAGDLIAAQSYLKTANTNLKGAQSEYNRAMTLFQDGCTVSQWEVAAKAAMGGIAATGAWTATALGASSGLVLVLKNAVTTTCDKVSKIWISRPFINEINYKQELAKGVGDFVVAMVADMAGEKIGNLAKTNIYSKQFNDIIDKMAGMTREQQAKVLKTAMEKAANQAFAAKGGASELFSQTITNLWDAVKLY